MDIKQLLEKMEEFAGEKVGQKPGDQWRGTDTAPPGKKLVGDSILKDLSKGKKAKSKEQELSEEFQAFLEAEFKDTVDKRPSRKGARHSRGHEPKSGYKTIKADESSMGDKDIELQDYRSMSHKEFQTAYGMTKTEWINKNKALVIQNPKLKQALGLDEGVPYKATNPHPALQDPIVAKVVKQMRPGLKNLDMNNEAFLYFAYEIGKMRAREMWEDYGPAIKYFYQSGIGVNEDANTDNKLAKLLTRFINQNEGADRAVAADAIEYIRKLGHIEQFATSLDYFAVDLDEGWESGPEEYEEPYDDADDAYDRQRQEKIDTEAEKEWAKLPKVSTYKLIGRGPNMEPNYEFGDEFDTLEQALEYREEIMKDPKTPYPEHIGIRTLTRVKDQTNEAIDSDIVQAMGQDTFNRAGYNPLRDERDYLDTLSKLKNLELKPGINQQMKDHIKQRILDLNAEARKKGFTQVESRGHKILATKLKDVERAKKFASGELKVPTPQERQAQLKQLEKAKPVKEYGANNVSPYGQPTQKVDPKQAQQVAANLNTQKTALNQLKQINPEIDPQKAATAMTKDLATMSPQEKEELAQIGKTVSPALGTPAFGSIKTAIQKSQIK